MAVTVATWRLMISRVDEVDKHADVGNERKGENRDGFNNGQWCFCSLRY